MGYGWGYGYTQNLTYHVQGRSGPVQVLAGVSACVPVGSLCALLGPSGCGKSSLFDVLCGVADMTRVHGRVTSQVRSAAPWSENKRHVVCRAHGQRASMRRMRMYLELSCSGELWGLKHGRVTPRL